MDNQGVIGTGRQGGEDVDVHRRFREGMRESDERLRLALDAGQMGTWEWNVATNEVIWSPRLEAIHGLAPGTFAGTFADYQKDMHPDDREHVLHAVGQSLEHGTDHHVEYRIVRPDGSIHWVEGRGKLVRDQFGVATRMIGICMDVTERKQAEEALRESEQRFARFMQQLPGLAWIKDVQGRYVYANEAAQRVFGTPEAQLYGRTDDEVFPADIAAQFRENDRKALASSVGIQTVETLPHDDGLLHYSLVNKFPISGPDGRTALIGGMAIDITDSKQAEERQKLLLDELNHRVKNTLAIVQAIASQTLRETPEPAAFKAAFSARLAALAGAHSLLTREQWQGIALHEVVAAALAPFSGDDRQEAISIDGPPVTIKPNIAVTLSLVLHELATNAAKYGAFTAPRGKVAIAWSETGERPGQPPSVELRWREHGGPAVQPPKKQGFGSRLIAASASQLGGEVSVRYDTAGIEVRFTILRCEAPD